MVASLKTRHFFSVSDRLALLKRNESSAVVLKTWGDLADFWLRD